MAPKFGGALHCNRCPAALERLAWCCSGCCGCEKGYATCRAQRESGRNRCHPSSRPPWSWRLPQPRANRGALPALAAAGGAPRRRAPGPQQRSWRTPTCGRHWQRRTAHRRPGTAPPPTPTSPGSRRRRHSCSPQRAAGLSRLGPPQRWTVPCAQTGPPCQLMAAAAGALPRSILPTLSEPSSP